MPARYRFGPWVRLGAGGPTPDTLGAGLPTRATIPVNVGVNGQPVGVTARLHGPGDVVSIDTRMVVRTDPPHLASEFEPNYFPLVEFDRPDQRDRAAEALSSWRAASSGEISVGSGARMRLRSCADQPH